MAQPLKNQWIVKKASDKNGRTRQCVLLCAVSFVTLLFYGLPVYCADDKNEGGAILFLKPLKSVIFEHKNHSGAATPCSSCHPGIFKKKAGDAESNYDFNMKAIYQDRYCGVCHNGHDAFAASSRCTACHVGVKGYARFLETKKKAAKPTP